MAAIYRRGGKRNKKGTYYMRISMRMGYGVLNEVARIKNQPIILPVKSNQT